jgi:hypothetical protein
MRIDQRSVAMRDERELDLPAGRSLNGGRMGDEHQGKNGHGQSAP